jgi:hypothetical protein
MTWLDHILAEVAKTFVQALKITGYLFWWLAIGLMAAIRSAGFQIQANSLRGTQSPNAGQRIEAKPCPICGNLNEAGATSCFACNHRL